MIVVPDQFAEQLVDYEGRRAATWLRSVPALAEEFAQRWRLTADGPLMHGVVGLALPVTTADGSPAVLKLTLVTAETRDEPTVLAAWKGAGAVRLMDCDPQRGVLLLERLDAARALAGEPIADAVRIASDLLRRLTIPAPPGLSRDLRAEAERWIEELPRDWQRLGQPFPRTLIDGAVAVCTQLGPRAARLLVNEDLHYDNVLAGTREPWLVIDPKPLVGDPEFSTVSLLWNRHTESTLDERFTAVVEGADLDHERARAWTLVRAVRNWLDLLALGDLADDKYRAVRDIAPWALG